MNLILALLVMCWGWALLTFIRYFIYSRNPMFKLQPNPTFFTEVPIPVAGEKNPVDVKFEFNHLDREKLKVFLASLSGREDDEALCEIVVGWKGVDGDFSDENLKVLLRNYPGAALCIVQKFVSESVEAKKKNL